MTGPGQHGDDFEAYLQQRSVLPHRLSKAERFEPPPELDRIVLERAKAAIRSSQSTPIYLPARWALPFGLAATVVMAFAVILHMRESGNTARTAANAPLPASAPMADSASATDAAAQSRPAAAPESATTVDRVVANDAATLSRSATSPASQSALSPAAPPSPPREAEGMRAQRMAPPPADERMSAQQVARASVEHAAREPAQTGAADAERVPTEELAHAGVGKPQRVPTQATQAREQKADRVREEATQAIIPSADKRAANQAVVSKQPLPPNQWLEKIARLRRDGKHAEADREVKAFHKVYPDLAVQGNN